MKLKETDDGIIMCKLFENLLQFYELDYTLNVFVHEVNSSSIKNSDEMRLLKSQENWDQHK